MIPTHAARLQSMLRSMIEVIIPALKPDDQLARDQAQILVGNLRILSDQADRTYEYDMVELRECVALLKKLTDVVSGGEQTQSQKQAAIDVIADAEPIATLAIPSHEVLTARLLLVKAAIDAVITASGVDGTAQSRKKAVTAVLA